MAGDGRRAGGKQLGCFAPAALDAAVSCLAFSELSDDALYWLGDLAYGETPRRLGAPAGTLVFDIELVSIVK